MTILIDDAGSGDLLHGAVIGAYRVEDDYFIYDLIHPRFFQNPLYREKRHLEEAKRIALELVRRLEPKEGERIVICSGDILDGAAEALAELYGGVVERGHIEGRCQYLVEAAYEDELRNIGYEPLEERTSKWGKSFWHMYRWLSEDPSRKRFAKTGFPKLKRYPLFR